MTEEKRGLSLISRPRLELSGAKLSMAFETLVAGAEEQGGIERYVEAVSAKTRLFREVLPESPLQAAAAQTLFAHMATVRRRIGPWAGRGRFEGLGERIAKLLEGREDTSTADARIAEFCAAFPDDRDHRWVRDLAAELLHNVDPERYPLMNRWVWDERANTGVIREIWHDPDGALDGTTLEVPDGYGTFLVLREELSQFLTSNGVYRDLLNYVDLLTAQLYALYICEQGGHYLRTDFSTAEDPLAHTRRLLGLDGISARGRTRLKVTV